MLASVVSASVSQDCILPNESLARRGYYDISEAYKVSALFMIEPLRIERYARWCERLAGQLRSAYFSIL